MDRLTCINASGTALLDDGDEAPMRRFLTVGRTYEVVSIDVAGEAATLVDDRGEVAEYTLARFTMEAIGR